MSLDINPATFCVGPYLEVRINADGYITYCHASDINQESQAHNISVTDLQDYWQGSYLHQLRLELEQGRSLPACHGCYSAERQNLISFRHRRNVQAAIFPDKDLIPSVIESDLLNSSKHHDWQPRFYHVSFSNLCNLACMMCKPKYSSRLSQYLQRVDLLGPNAPVLDWTTDEAWQKFCHHLLHNQHIMCLHVMGGEPMLHHRFRQLLETLVQHHHTGFAISIVTNGTIYDQGIMDLLLKFQKVIIEISIETVDVMNDYIRHYSNTKEIISNIHQYCRHRGPDCEIVLRTVPQALSVMTYHGLLDFAQQHNLVVDSNVMTSPRFLSIGVLPRHLRESVSHQLTVYDLDQPTGTTELIRNTRSQTQDNVSVAANARFIKSQLDAPEPNDIEDLRTKLAEYCNRFDRGRLMNLWHCAPELAGWLAQYGYDTNPNTPRA